MKYYRITHSIDKKIVGRVDKIKNIETTGYWDTIDSFNLQGRDSKVIGDPALPCPEMHRSVKMTDWIDIMILSDTIYPIMTGELLNFLKKYIQTDYQTWRINIKKGAVIYEYYLLHIDIPKTNFIEYSKSNFSLFKINKDFQYVVFDKTLTINNDTEYFEASNKYFPFTTENMLKATKIAFRSPNKNEHFFRCISAGYFGYFVSEFLKIEIEKQGFTGMRFEELNEIKKDVIIETL
jgi:hypothetical protein